MAGMREIEPIQNAAEYDVIRLRGPAGRIDDVLFQFKELVTTAMAGGWNPAGGVAVYHRVEAQERGEEPKDLVTFLQATVRYQP
jgi:hypothetical protein